MELQVSKLYHLAEQSYGYIAGAFPHYFLTYIVTGCPLSLCFTLEVMQPCEVSYQDWCNVLQRARVRAKVLHNL